MQFHIDKIDIKNKKISIKGWVFSSSDVKIRVDNAKIDKFLKISRPDVRSYAKKNFKQDIKIDCGFDLEITEFKNKFDLIFDDSHKTKKISINCLNLKIDKIKNFIKSKSKTITNYIALIKFLKPIHLKKAYFIYKTQGKEAFIAKLKSKFKKDSLSYNDWFINNHLPNQKELQDQRNTKFKFNPLISIITPTFNTPKKFLIEMIESIKNQTYANWELCIADGNSNDETKKILKEYAKKDKRIKVKFLPKNLMISGNSNEAISIATGDYIGLFDHDDLLTPNALFEIVKVLNEDKKIDFIYTDEDKVNENSNYYFDPYFKKDFNLYLLRSQNYICHFSVFKKDLIDDEKKVFRSEFDGSQDYDLILRLSEKAKKIYHIHKILYHWRVHSNSTAGDASSKMYAYEAGKKALIEHYKRQKIDIKDVEKLEILGTYKTNFILNNKPLISILIPNYEHISDLKKCINSILNRSTYKNYEIIIIENNSKSKEIFEFYKELEKNPKIKVVKLDINEFNFSKICNWGAKFAKGEFILLLNNDTEVITPNWLEEMLMLNQQDKVGIVGAKLLYPDDTIQHAGVIIGMGGIAGHIYLGANSYDMGHSRELTLMQNFSAVTGACLMIRKKLYDELNGLDEINFKVAFNDVDLCLRAIYKGYQVIWTPFAKLYHYESKSRGDDNKSDEKFKRLMLEAKNFENKHFKYLQNKDPFFNKNFRLDRNDCCIKFD